MAQASASRDSLRDNIRKRQLREILLRYMRENLTSPASRGRMPKPDSQSRDNGD